jgi:hypothetical protein
MLMEVRWTGFGGDCWGWGRAGGILGVKDAESFVKKSRWSLSFEDRSLGYQILVVATLGFVPVAD